MKEIQSGIAEVAGALLWRHEAIRVNLEEPFRLASGDLAPIYINCRLMISFPAARDLLTGFAHFLCAEKGIECDAVAGGETAGIPFGAWLADRLNKPFLYVRKQAKGYGVKTRLEGLARGRVLLVEDLITDGGSKRGFIEAIREEGASVGDCLTVVDREQGGAAQLAEFGVALHSIVTVATCLQIGRRNGLISQAEGEEVERYLRDPKGWSAGRAEC